MQEKAQAHVMQCETIALANELRPGLSLSLHCWSAEAFA